ncbi:hypothetical protein BJV78DRAFT_1280750 [Lactifluus subvellereus]|nr:hypothetical protein BJV78DRAFT_1280750 [Lactifluus subvellereus]
MHFPELSRKPAVTCHQNTIALGLNVGHAQRSSHVPLFDVFEDPQNGSAHALGLRGLREEDGEDGELEAATERHSCTHGLAHRDAGRLATVIVPPPPEAFVGAAGLDYTNSDLCVTYMGNVVLTAGGSLFAGLGASLPSFASNTIPSPAPPSLEKQDGGAVHAPSTRHRVSAVRWSSADERALEEVVIRTNLTSLVPHPPPPPADPYPGPDPAAPALIAPDNGTEDDPAVLLAGDDAGVLEGDDAKRSVAQAC